MNQIPPKLASIATFFVFPRYYKIPNFTRYLKNVPIPRIFNCCAEVQREHKCFVFLGHTKEPC